MYKKNEVVFILAKCETTGKNFYVRHDIGADGKWVRTYGLEDIPTSKSGYENKKSQSEVCIDYNNFRIGPQYKCPYCGNKNLFHCVKPDKPRKCRGVVYACSDTPDDWSCYEKGESGKTIPIEDNIFTTDGTIGKAQ